MISIITSLYKSDQHLPSFIKRVKKMSKYLMKKGISHEFIILLNNPSEKEIEILERPLHRVRIIPRNLETIYATWNEGVKNASYENICLWNVDDRRFGKAIIDGLKDLAKDIDIVYFPFIYFRYLKIGKFKLLAKIKIFYPPLFDKKRFIKEMHCGPFFMTKKSAFSKIGLFDSEYTVAGDFEWCARAASKGLKFRRNSSIAGIFTSDGTTLSGSHSLKHSQENEKIHKLYSQC